MVQWDLGILNLFGDIMIQGQGVGIGGESLLFKWHRCVGERVSIVTLEKI